MSDEPDAGGVLGQIVDRKRRENDRRERFRAVYADDLEPGSRGKEAIDALRRPKDENPRIIAEVKFRSPSAGTIATWSPGEAVRMASTYGRGGASAISVLADRPGFGGSPLDVRRVAHSVDRPVLFKEFVLNETQIELADACQASMVLLLVRALSQRTLLRLVECVRSRGMEPVVEAASPQELERAIDTGATIVGVNARDLRTFTVDREMANACLEATPDDRIAVFMSGVRTVEDYRNVAEGRADAVLIGEGLMRTEDPAAFVQQMLRSA